MLNRLLIITINLIIVMLGLAFIGFNTYERNGLKFRFKEFDQTLNHHLQSMQRNDFCIKQLPQLAHAKYCLLSKPAKPTIVMMGDSHAFQHHHSLTEQFPLENILTIGESACLPFTGSSSSVPKHCSALNESLLKYLESESSIKKIYVAGYWSYLKTNTLGAMGPTNPSQTEEVMFESNALSTLLRLVITSKDITIVLDNPHWWNINPRDCLFRRKIFHPQKLENRCNAAKEIFSAEDKEIISIVTDLKENFQNIRILDSKNYLCGPKACSVVIDNSEVYYDANHLTRLGSNLISFKNN